MQEFRTMCVLVNLVNLFKEGRNGFSEGRNISGRHFSFLLYLKSRTTQPLTFGHDALQMRSKTTLTWIVEAGKGFQSLFTPISEAKKTKCTGQHA